MSATFPRSESSCRSSAEAARSLCTTIQMMLLRCSRLFPTCSELMWTLLSSSRMLCTSTSLLLRSRRRALPTSSTSPDTLLSVSSVWSVAMDSTPSTRAMFWRASFMKVRTSDLILADWLSSSWYESRTSCSIAALCAATVLVAVLKCAFTSPSEVSTDVRSISMLLLASCSRPFTSCCTACSCWVLALSCRISPISSLTSLSPRLVCAISRWILARPVDSSHSSSLRRLCRASRSTNLASRSAFVALSRLVVSRTRRSTCMRRASAPSCTRASSPTTRSVVRCAPWIEESWRSSW
mmetsp:Transcript_35409/g.90987  ORF Transcript_35409/g.90987 Transcript_35409/m.90987 type:complete len:296 (+) Transcript_35409:750-1637(+)